MKKENNIVYHPEDDILCSTCSKDKQTKRRYSYSYSIELTGGLVVDIDKAGNITGLEILDASRVLRVSKKELAKRFKIVKDRSIALDKLKSMRIKTNL